MIRKKYRIVADKYAGFEVQEWSWWWPFWSQGGFANTHTSLERAEWWIRDRVRNGGVIKHLGYL